MTTEQELFFLCFRFTLFFLQICLMILAIIICVNASLFGHGGSNAPPKTSPKVKIVKIIDGGTINMGHNDHDQASQIVKIVKVEGGTAPPNNGQPWPNQPNYGNGQPGPVEILKIIDGGTYNTADTGNNVYGANEPNVQIIKIIKQTKPGGTGWYNSNKNNGGWH